MAGETSCPSLLAPQGAGQEHGGWALSLQYSTFLQAQTFLSETPVHSDFTLENSGVPGSDLEPDVSLLGLYFPIHEMGRVKSAIGYCYLVTGK